MEESNEQQQPDRLSSLPDTLITTILSLLPINSAAQTSILSRHWRHLWTRVTRFVFHTNKPKAPETVALIIDRILPQLTSPKFHNFELIMLRSASNLSQLNETEPFFLDLIHRNLEHLVFRVGSRCFFLVPSCVFRSQTLVILELFGRLKIDVPENVAATHLPCLKTLSLECLLHVPPCLAGNLFVSCPLLEDLLLGFWLIFDTYRHTLPSPVNILTPNLKSLRVHMYTFVHLPRLKISIDAPELSYISLHDCYSYYYWIRKPTSLVDLWIDLTGSIRHVLVSDDLLEFGRLDVPTVMLAFDDTPRTVDQMSKFVAGTTSTVRSLTLDLLSPVTNILPFRHAVDIPIFFSKLVYLKINLHGFQLYDFRDLLLSLYCFPNLEKFEVKLMMDDRSILYNNMRWILPDYPPQCFENKLKLVILWGMDGNQIDLELVAYLLWNAMILEEICIDVLSKECEFATSVSELPRISSTCKVNVSGRNARSSGDEAKP